MTILSIDHIKIAVGLNDIEEARHFYCDLLGLPEVIKPEPLRERGGFWLQVGECQVHIGREDGIDRRQTSAHIGYLVDDIRAWREKLAEADVDMVEAIAIPDVERFYVYDPAGNRIEFMQRI
jgi:catechol 2,3-dioxygenase-like lactoylglutathione lyase family enzyme